MTFDGFKDEDFNIFAQKRDSVKGRIKKLYKVLYPKFRELGEILVEEIEKKYDIDVGYAYPPFTRNTLNKPDHTYLIITKTSDKRRTKFIGYLQLNIALDEDKIGFRLNIEKRMDRPDWDILGNNIKNNSVFRAIITDLINNKGYEINGAGFEDYFPSEDSDNVYYFSIEKWIEVNNPKFKRIVKSSDLINYTLDRIDELMPVFNFDTKHASGNIIITQDFITIFNNKKQIILYGPPGTGKTYITKKIADDLLEMN